MISCQLLSILVLFATTFGDQINNKKFPDGFMFGVATASYQIEGGWNEDGKGPNIWDTITHEHPDYVRNKDNGDIACDSYHKYKEDVQLLKSLGVTHYRFSLSWSRILPTGYANKINAPGVKYYRNLIKELRANNIEPFVTIFHWDLPQPIQDVGGWPNPDIVKWYTDYARICFELFGDLVKYWTTINEPMSICHMGYGTGEFAPAIKSPEAEFLCSHHLILSHANAYHLYNDTYRESQKGYVGIAIDSDYYTTESGKIEDIAAAETYRHFYFGWFANPLVYGDYPSVMKKQVAHHSQVAGYKKSLLPEFSENVSKKIKGTLDYLGVNMYTSYMVKANNKTNSDTVFWQDCVEADLYQLSSWKSAASPWLKLTGWGLGGLIKWISKTYKSIPIIITENGMSDNGTSLADDLRIEQIQTYLSSLRDAMEEDYVNVFGYTHWSFLDNFEWRSGYSERFGVTHIDHTSPNRTRTPKESFEFYRNVIKTKCLVDKCIE